VGVKEALENQKVSSWRAVYK